MATGTQGERIARLEEKVTNLVDDMQEVKEQLKRIAGYTGPTRSEVEALKKAIFEALNKDALGNTQQYSESDHPKRRASDNSKLPPMVVEIIKAVITFVLGGTFLWLFTEIFPRIFSVTTG